MSKEPATNGEGEMYLKNPTTPRKLVQLDYANQEVHKRGCFDVLK